MPDALPVSDLPELLTTAEVARIFRVTVYAVIGWVRKGQLEAMRTPGGTYRFRRDTVVAFFGQQTQVPTQEEAS